MGYTTCKNAVKELLIEGDERFGDNYGVPRKMAERLLDVCEAVDALVKKIEEESVLESVDVNADEETCAMRFIIVCDELILREGMADLARATSLVDTFGFSKWKRDHLKIELCVQKVWERV